MLLAVEQRGAVLGVGAATKIWLKPTVAQPATGSEDTYSTAESLDR